MTRKAAIVFVLVAILIATSCSPGTLPNSSLAVYFRVESIALEEGTHDVSVQCHNGEQMIGGGYTMLNMKNEYGSIFASYPSTPSTWTVSYSNSGPANGNVLLVLAYCVPTSFPLDMQIESGSVPTQEQVPGGYTLYTVTAKCQSGWAPTGGGFKSDVPPTFSYKNAFYRASKPVFDGVSGWEVTQFTEPGTPSLSTMAYVLCTQHLNPRPPQQISFAGLPPQEQQEKEILCEPDEFASGTGFELTGTSAEDLQIPAFVYQNKLGITNTNSMTNSVGNVGVVAFKQIIGWTTCMEIPEAGMYSIPPDAGLKQ